jgi:hypothetical protein
MLLEAGGSLETIDRDDLCQFAATNTAVIKALINRGVVVREIVASNGSTPLHRPPWTVAARMCSRFSSMCAVLI